MQSKHQRNSFNKTPRSAVDNQQVNASSPKKRCTDANNLVLEKHFDDSFLDLCKSVNQRAKAIIEEDEVSLQTICRVFDEIQNFDSSMIEFFHTQYQSQSQELLLEIVFKAKKILLKKWNLGHEQHKHHLEAYTAFAHEIRDDIVQFQPLCNQFYQQNELISITKVQLYREILEYLFSIQENFNQLNQQHKKEAELDGTIFNFIETIKDGLCAILGHLPDETRVHALYLVASSHLMLSSKVGADYESHIDACLNYAVLIQNTSSNPLEKLLALKLMTICLNKPSKSSAFFKFNFLIQQYREAKQSNNTNNMAISYNDLVLEKEASSQTQAIPNLLEFYTDMAKAYTNTAQSTDAKKMYYKCLQRDKYHLESLNALIELLQQEKELYASNSGQTKYLDSQLTDLYRKLNRAKTIADLPKETRLLFIETLEGSWFAYDALKCLFEDKSLMNQFSDFLHYHTDEELQSTSVNALFDIAHFVDKRVISEPFGVYKKQHITRFFELAAQREFSYAFYELGCIAEKNYDYPKAKMYFEKAAQLKHKKAQLRLIFIYCDEQNYILAHDYLKELKLEKTEFKGYSSRITELQGLNVTNQSDMTQGEKPIIYFDIDNTLMKSQDLAGTFYELYPDNKFPSNQDLAHNFYTGSKSQWLGIFKALKALGFSIGLCTAKYKAAQKICVLYKQIMQDFGAYIDPSLIIFTDRNPKHSYLLNSCQSQGGKPYSSILVDDLLRHCEDAKACGFRAVRAENLVLDSESFSTFQQHLMQVAVEVKAMYERDNDYSSNRYSLFSSSENTPEENTLEENTPEVEEEFNFNLNRRA